MTFVKALGWLIVLLPLSIALYNFPLTAIVSLYSKLRHGEVRNYPKMPFPLVLLGILVTAIIGATLARVFNANEYAMKYAVGFRSGLYLLFRY